MIARRIAVAMIDAATSLLPAAQRHWGEAMRHEVDAIDENGEALRFAIGCLGFAIRAAFTVPPLPEEPPMRHHPYLRPRRITALCAVAAVGLGLTYMSIAGAPVRYLAMNSGALVLGLVIAGLVTLLPHRSGGGVMAALGPLLLLTSLFGVAAEGAARWITIAGISVQLSLVLLPVMAVGFARSRDTLSTISIVTAALALAIQPDRAMAGALAAAMAALALGRRERNVLVALAASACGFAVTLIRPDTLGAMPYVDRILYSSFDVHPLAGLAVLGGVIVMLVPAIVGWLGDRDHHDVYAVFGALWLGIIAAAALGNYPTPVVGYGGSAILGYALSLLGLPKYARTATAEQVTADPPARKPTAGKLRAALSFAR